MTTNIQIVEQYLLNLQEAISHALEQEDTKAKFIETLWQRPEGGGGRTRALSCGAAIEKAGVNFSHVLGNRLPLAANLQRPELIDSKFHAMGVSVIVHPLNPFAPTCHLNVRFFTAEKTGVEPIWWFGGGFDLTPYYGFVEDCQHWHRTAKKACDPFGADVYSQFKKTADEYFFLKHRNEPRGIGGIFFDNLTTGGFDQAFNFMQNVGNHFIPAYLPLLARRKNIPYNQKQRDFQCYRRGRYVEFNLIQDRGTLFGLQFGGRSESILISLPPIVHWNYDWQPEAGSDEEKLYKEFLVPKDWV